MVAMRKSHLVQLEKQRRLSTRRTAGNLPSSPPLPPVGSHHMLQMAPQSSAPPPAVEEGGGMRAVGLNPDVHPNVALDIQLLQQVIINSPPPPCELNLNPRFKIPKP
jgi:hypothetical protein